MIDLGVALTWVAHISGQREGTVGAGSYTRQRRHEPEPAMPTMRWRACRAERSALDRRSAKIAESSRDEPALVCSTDARSECEPMPNRARRSSCGILSMSARLCLASDESAIRARCRGLAACRLRSTLEFRPLGHSSVDATASVERRPCCPSPPDCGEYCLPIRSTNWGPGSAMSRWPWACTTTRTARSPRPACSSRRGLLPALLAPVLVARVERSPRRGSLPACMLIEALLTLALAVLLWHFLLAWSAVLVAIDGIVAVAATALLRASATRVIASTNDRRARRRARRRPRAATDEPLSAGERRTQLRLHGSLRARPGDRRRCSCTGSAARSRCCSTRSRSSFAPCADAWPADPIAEDQGETRLATRLRAAWQHMQAVPALRTLLLDRGDRAGLLRLGGAGRGALRQDHPERGRSRLRAAHGGLGHRRGAGSGRVRTLSASTARTDADRSAHCWSDWPTWALRRRRRSRSPAWPPCRRRRQRHPVAVAHQRRADS